MPFFAPQARFSRHGPRLGARDSTRRPPAGTSAAKTRSARPCCLLCASDRGISKRPHSRQKRPKQTSDRLPPSARSQTAPAAHLCPDTLHTAHASPALDSSTTTPQISSRSSTTRKPKPSRPSRLHTAAQPPLEPLTPSCSSLPFSALSQILISHHHHHQSPLSISPLTP